MATNKPKVTKNAYDTLNFSLIRHSRNLHPREENNCGDESSIVILDNEHLCDTIIASNAYIRSNKVIKIRDLVISSLHIGLHIGDEKYRI